MAHGNYSVTTGTHIAFSSGGAGYGVLYNAHYFVLMYYSQVMGLDPALMSNPFVAGIIDILGIVIYMNVGLLII